MEKLESQRKDLIKKYKTETNNKVLKILVAELFPNLPIGYSMFETEKERLLISRRASFTKQLAKLYLHAKERKRYNFVHFNCGLGQKLPQAATRNISKFITCSLKTGKITSSLSSLLYSPTCINTISSLHL